MCLTGFADPILRNSLTGAIFFVFCGVRPEPAFCV